MSLFTPFTLKLAIGFLLLCILCILFLSIRRRQIIPIIICLILIAIPFVLTPPQQSPKPEKTPEQQQQFIQEQMDFADWYTKYNKTIDAMNNNWQQYHKILAAFTNDEISVQTAKVRLTDLYTNSKQLSDQLIQLTPAHNLSDENHNHVVNIINKTRVFATKQTTIIEKSVYAIDSQNLKINATHDAQVNALQKILAIENPINLDVIEEIAIIKENLRD